MSKMIFAASLALLLALPSTAQVFPSAPQNSQMTDGIDGNGQNGPQAGFVRVPPGNSGFVDPSIPIGAAPQFCRFVTNTGSKQVILPIGNTASWQSMRAGVTNGAPPGGIAEVVCCRPQSESLCGGASVQSLSYTQLGNSQTLAASCADGSSETQTWSCGQTGSGAMADGSWTETSDVVTPPPCVPTDQTCSSITCTLHQHDSCGGNVDTGVSCPIVPGLSANCRALEAPPPPPAPPPPSGPSCTPSTGACQGTCGTGTQTVTNSDCSTTQQSCQLQACGATNNPGPTPPPQCVPDGSCNGACGGTGTDSCGHSCQTAACPAPTTCSAANATAITCVALPNCGGEIFYICPGFPPTDSGSTGCDPGPGSQPANCNGVSG